MNDGYARLGEGPTDVGVPRPGGVGAESVLQTHLSVLFFLGDVVLKVKKPVHLPFVDFTSPEARRRACEEEVRCNRRLAPDVYLGVATTTLGEQVIDHGVVMRRLPSQRNLATMVRRDDPAAAQAVDAVASVLAAFHAGADRSPQVDDGGDVDRVRATWDAVVADMAPFADVVGPAVLGQADELAQRFFVHCRRVFLDRVDAGRVCDGHGDLQAADIFVLDDGPRILDGVEFDPSLRHVDVMADVAFLVMDLERLGAPRLAERFLTAYQAAAGDVFPTSLLDYYCAERAMVRALVACLRGAQRAAEFAGGDGAGRPPEFDEASALVALALEHLRSGRVVLGVVSGLPGTGKSTLAAGAGKALGWPVLRSDQIRRELFGDAGNAGDAGPYSVACTDDTYRAMMARAGALVDRGQSVVLDATFTDPKFRRAVIALAEAAGCDLVVIETRAPVDVAATRADVRRDIGRDLSDADAAVARAMAVDAEPWPGAHVIDTVAHDPTSAAAEAVRVLRCLPLTTPVRAATTSSAA